MNNDRRSRLKLRLLGLAATALGFYLIFWVALARVDIGWMVPTDKMANAVIVFWRDLPFFSVEKGPAPDGQGQVIYYTVPTQQVTRRDMARMMGTNVTAHPAPPVETGPAGKNGTASR